MSFATGFAKFASATAAAGSGVWTVGAAMAFAPMSTAMGATTSVAFGGLAAGINELEEMLEAQKGGKPKADGKPTDEPKGESGQGDKPAGDQPSS